MESGVKYDRAFTANVYEGKVPQLVVQQRPREAASLKEQLRLSKPSITLEGLQQVCEQSCTATHAAKDRRNYLERTEQRKGENTPHNPQYQHSRPMPPKKSQPESKRKNWKPHCSSNTVFISTTVSKTKATINISVPPKSMITTPGNLYSDHIFSGHNQIQWFPLEPSSHDRLFPRSLYFEILTHFSDFIFLRAGLKCLMSSNHADRSEQNCF